MNREIKFRGKRIDSGEWVYGYYWQNDDISAPDITHHIMTDLFPQINFSVDHATVGQYTGLKDKNGIEIYEGDIFMSENGEKCVIEWDDNDLCFTSFRPLSSFQKIGNIHDNKELIKEK